MRQAVAADAHPLAELAERRHVYATDLRGHGTSGWVPWGYTIRDYVEDIGTFLRVVSGPAVLVLSGSLKSLPGMDLRLAITLLGLLFVPGILIVSFLPETKDQPLPE